MADGYCWVCDRSVDRDPCPSCGTSLYSAPAAVAATPAADEVFDTAPQIARGVTAKPVVVAAAVIAILVLIFWLFRSGAVIS